MFTISFLQKVSFHSCTHVVNMLHLPSLQLGVQRLAAPMPACAAVLQQQHRQQQNARHQTSLLPSVAPQQQQRCVSRQICNSTAAKAPVIKPKWDTETARKALASLANEPTEFARGVEVLDSIVKVYTVFSRPDYFLPWQNHPKRESTGTGFVIRHRLILTNAHVVADQTYVTVKRHGSGTKYRADVVGVGHDVDLALLTVEDDAFWESGEDAGSMKPLQLGDVPQLQEQVLVVGYPTGGDNTSITSGVVSRVEVTQYVHAASHLMAIQIDAAINPGNSGGPALRGDVVVGVAFQNLPHADNIGYIIPLPVVRRFLSEVMRYGYYRGFCSLGIVFQTMDNPHLRRALGMAAQQSGVMINRIQPTTSTAQVLRKGDVLMEFDGVPIANDGTVHFRARERIFFTSLITLKPTGSTARVKVLRDGSSLEYDLQLDPLQTLVPVHKYDQLPSYFIYAGLVFVPLSQPYLHEYGDDWMSNSPRRLVDKALNSLMQKPEQQIIVLSQVLVDDINTGYQQFQNLQVLRVNGVEVLNLGHLKQLIRGADAAAVAVEPPPESATAAARNCRRQRQCRFVQQRMERQVHQAGAGGRPRNHHGASSGRCGHGAVAAAVQGALPQQR
ncbi:trypsin-like cysteine/serine peptidase domain-containing protein [Scenedesmus sp. NREL 46B-D3]|nr:trypsin-like cysteine/serine peptidase domain-containing protein [Scenedesmus sp. NREL 46B-D3]